jgi:uncharacterized protein YndB with AHSA1/START domain
MLINDSIVIDAPIDKVWRYIASPDLWNLFNDKIAKCEQISTAGGRIGSVYSMDFRMGTKTTSTHCEITDLQLCKIIQMRSTLSDPSHITTSGTLTYELEDLSFKTKVREKIDVVIPEINIFMRAIIWLISRFGSPAGETNLMKLKRIIEQG